MKNKIRSTSHINGEKAVAFIKEHIIPSEWVVREFSPDYGIDLDIELFEKNENEYSAVGEHIFIQVKGTEKAQYGFFELEGRKCEVLKFRIEISEINLINSIGCALPVLLIVVDLSTQKAYQICLNDYISKVLPLQDSNYRNRNSITINIPIANELSSDNIDALRWYGKRIKIYSIFHEMNTAIDDLSYLSHSEYLSQGIEFVEKYRQYSVFYDKFPFFYFVEIKNMFDALHNNDYMFKEELRVNRYLISDAYPKIDKDNWKNKPVIINGDYLEPVSAFQAAQIMSIDRLCKYIKNYSGMYETYCREAYMPCLILGVYQKDI